MSVSLSVKRDRLQRQVEELEQSLSVTNTELELLSSETDDESDDDVTEAGESAAGLLALREKVQKDIQNLVNVLGTEDGPIYISDDDDSSSEESELDLTVDSCLQMNLVYQQVVQETLDQLETLLTQNHRQQKELMSQLSGPVKEPPRDQRTSSSYQQPNSLYLGRFLKPYFKDKLTGLGPPANQETKEKSSRMTGCLDDNKLKVKRWESWQKTLLIHAVTRDSLRRVMQPKLSRVDYLSQKLSSAKETDKQQLREQIDSLEREIGLLKAKKEEELFGDRYEEHDWQKISNIDFEGTKDAEDIRRFWQNFLHPSINKTRWSQEEVQQLEEVSRRHGERHWEIIAQELGTGRTAFMCLQMFQRFISGSLRRSTWSPAEDALLRELVDKMRIGNFIPYTQMSYFMEGRDPAQLIYRWNQVLDPSLKKGPWTKQEDQLLLDAVSRHGEKNWWKIRLEVPGRTDSACRDRYLDCLKEGIKRGAFDKRERDLLLQLVKKHGVGRWAKIAAEIPHRYDAQCLREWRKLIKQQLPRAQKVKAKKPRSQAGKKKASPARRRIRRRLVKVKEEEESTEEEEMVVHYMDSDEDEKKEILEVKRKEKEEEEVENEEVEKEEEEEEYILPPMEEWIPSEKEEHFNFLRFQSVVLPSSADVSGGKLVRSTIAGKFGRSVITGPSPRVLKWEEHRSSNTMMMVSPDQLRAYFLCKANKFNRRGRVTEMGLGYELQAAVTPWIGNLLIPAKSRLTAADSLRERGEKTQLTSTSVFMLFLQTMNIDTTGCKEMIEQRRNNVVLLTPPPDPSSVQIKNPHTVAGMLQQKRVIKEELDTQILDQLQFFQQQQLQKQQVRPQELVQQPQPLPPQTSSVPVAQTVFIQHPVLQQQQPALNALPLSSHGIPPGGVVTSLIPAPFTPHNLSVPLASAPRPSSVLFCQQATPLTQNLKVQLAPHTTDSTVLSASSIFAAFPSPANSTLNPPAEREQIEGEWANCTGAEKRALQEASEAEVETTKTPPSCQTESTNLPPQPVSLPPQQVCLASIQPVPQAPPSYLTVSPTVPQSSHAPAGIISPAAPHRLNVPPVSVESSISLQNATPSHPDRGVSTVLNLSSGSPPSSSDHDYTSINPNPTSGHHGSNSCLPTPAKQPPSQPPKNQLREKKRRRAEEQQKVEGSETDQCVDGAGTGVIQKERRVRKPSQKAKALQEATKAKAEAKMKRLSSSSPCKKRRRKSRCQDKVQVPAQPMTQLPGLCLRPGQSMWVMTPSGLLQLAEAPSQGLQLALVPTAPLPPSPGHILSPTTPRPPVPLTSGGYRLVAPKPPAMCVPVNVPNQNQPPTCSSISLPPTCVLQPVPNPISSPAPSWSSAPPVPPNVFLPYKGTVRVDPADPPSFRRETLQFDPSLMFFESQEEVRDWLSGRGGVVVSGTDAALPYLPPFVSSLSTLSALLQAKKSLTKSSLQLLSEGSKRRHPQTKPRRDSSTEKTSSQPPADLPDSTSDLRPPEDQPAPPNISELNQEEESELVALVRQLVAERFSGNPAYQLLKARFLSCFTLPALMATIQPITATTLAPEDSQEEEEEDEEKEKEEDEEVVELKKIKERGRRRRSERSLQLRSGPRTPANHFSGMNTTHTPQQPGPAETTPPVQ